MDRIIRFFKTAGVYFLGNVLTKLISFILLPLYTSRIDPVSYGEYGLVLTILNVVVPIAYFAIWDSVFRFAFDYEKDCDKYKVLNNGIVIMIFGTLLLLVGVVVSSFMYKYSYPILIYIYALSMGFQYYYSVICRALKDNNTFVFSGCVNSIFSILLNIVLIIVFNMGVESLYISYIFGVVLQVLIIEYKKKFISQLSFKGIKASVIMNYLKFSIPVMVSAISNWLLNGLTQLYITVQLGTYFNGMYNVANKFSSIMILIIGVFQFAWNEMAYDLANDSVKTSYYKKSINEILRFCLIGVSLLILIVKIVYPFMVDKQYYESLVIIPVLLIGTMSNSYSGFLGTLFLADKSTNSLLTTTLFSGVINFILLSVLTPKFGLLGAVLSLTLSYIFYVLIRLVLLNKKMNVTVRLTSLKPIVLLVLSTLSFYLIDSIVALIIVFVILTLISIWIVRDIIKYGVNMVKKKSLLRK